MLDFIIRKPFIQNAQSSINRLNPKVSVHLHQDLPLPSVSLIKKMSGAVSKINGLEPQISSLSDDELRLKTKEFKIKIQEALKEPQVQVKKIKDMLRESSDASFGLLASMSRRLHMLVNQIESLTLQNATYRLVAYLLEEIPRDVKTSPEVQLTTPKGVIASRLAIQPETLSRSLAELRQGN